MMSVPNLIKQPAVCCVYCGKSYRKKTNLDRHVVLCELLKKSRNYKPDEDMTDSVPSNLTMYRMLLELGNEFNKFKDDMIDIKKYVVKTKKKINALDWLNGHLTPDIKFTDLLDKIYIEEEDLDYVFNNSFDDTLKHIFSKSLYILSENECPIIAFIQKTNVFYIYEQSGWIELTRELLCSFLNKVSMKLYRKFMDFKKRKAVEIKTDDKLSLACDKVSVKIMEVDFTKESVLNRIRSFMYSRMKKDIRGLVEYEFDF